MMMVETAMSEEIMSRLSRSVLACFEARRKFLIDAIEPAVGKDRDNVAGLQFGRDAIDDCGRIRMQFGRSSRSH